MSATSKKPTSKKQTPKEELKKDIPFDQEVKARPYSKKPGIKGINPTMMVITSSFQMDQNSPVLPTFRMVPMSNDCPFKECYWLPTTRVFIVIDKNPITTFQLFPKLTAAGGQAIAKMKNEQGKTVNVYAQERLQVEDYHQHFLLDVSEIDQFISAHAFNSDFDWLSFIQTK